MNYIDLHLNKVLSDSEILDTIQKMFEISKDKIIITSNIEEISKYHNYDIWINKISRRYGDFHLTLSIYPQSKIFNKTELEFAEYFCEHNNLECAIVNPEDDMHAAWLLVLGSNKNKIFIEDVSYTYPENEDGITILKYK